jgi:hypothetical protein
MASTETKLENVTIDEAVKRLVEVTKNNSSRISNLEGQIDEICKDFAEYREKIQAIQLTTTTFQEETKVTFDEFRRQWKDMYTDMKHDISAILLKLGENPEPSAAIMIEMPKLEATTQEEHKKQDPMDKGTLDTSKQESGRPFSMMNFGSDNTPQRTIQMSPYLGQVDPNWRMPTSSAHPIYPVKHSIIVPPSSAAPAFYGKSTESPTQFLIRVQEYAESVHAWDRPTLVNGISQFLRDSALEWYCQLRMSHRRPNTWTEFEDLFLAQFNSPIRKAIQEQEWHECKQKEKETINEFLVRLRALWREQKPKETERDLVKHLFCRMRNDLLNMMGVSRNASLDEVLTEVQQIEDILYRRAKGERLAKQLKQASSSITETTSNKRTNEDYTCRTTARTNREDLSNNYIRKARNYQVNEVTPGRNRTTAGPNTGRQSESYEDQCYSCGGYGHWARDCPMQYGTYRQERNKPNSKNVTGALGERTSRAPM